jgi:monooxygenase
MPKQGDGAPWMMSSSYYRDVKLLRSDSVADPNLRFDTSRQVAAASAVAVPA